MTGSGLANLGLSIPAVAGVMAANVAVSSGSSTELLTNGATGSPLLSLPVGLWLVSGSVFMVSAAGAIRTVDAWLAPSGTNPGTFTITGQSADSSDVPVTNGSAGLTFAALVRATTAGNLGLLCQASGASVTATAATLTTAQPRATGLVAVRLVA